MRHISPLAMPKETKCVPAALCTVLFSCCMCVCFFFSFFLSLFLNFVECQYRTFLKQGFRVDEWGGGGGGYPSAFFWRVLGRSRVVGHDVSLGVYLLEFHWIFIRAKFALWLVW